MKIDWTDILPRGNQRIWHSESAEEGARDMLWDSLSSLRQAEKEGKCCLNPPDKMELIGIIREVVGCFCYINEISCTYTVTVEDVAKAIAERIKKGE